MKQTLVVIEDDKPIRDMYVWKLKAEGFIVFSAENGQAGITVIEETRPDLIF